MRTKEQEVAAYTYLKVPEVARRIGCTAEHVVNLIERGELVAVDISVGERAMYRIAPAELDAFIARRRVRTDAEKAVG